MQSSLTNSWSSHPLAPYVLWGAIAVGAVMVLVGAADVASRVSRAAFGDSAGKTLFAPAAAIGDPSVLDTLGRSPTGETVHGANAYASTTAFVPARLKVPSVGIDAAVQQVGTRPDGTMGLPSTFSDTAWYKDGPAPGAPGNAVFAGHVNNALTLPGVFGHLSQVHVGDYVTVADASGKTLVYKVTAIDQYPADEAPAQSIFAATGPSHVVLITCDGEWVPAEKTFNKRLVITASPAY